MVKRNLFSAGWLDAPDREGSTSSASASFPTNGDRFAAIEIQKRLDPTAFTRAGFMMQAVAAGWHHKSAAQLRELADQVGRGRIQVIHGTIDRMITFPHSQVLWRELNARSNGADDCHGVGRGGGSGSGGDDGGGDDGGGTHDREHNAENKREEEQDEDDDQVKMTRFEGKGHVLSWEERGEFTRLMEELIEKTEKMNRPIN